MSYTYDWTEKFIENTKIFDKKSFKICMEIGCFEGFTSNYIIDNLLEEDGKLICVDPLTDKYLNGNLSENEAKMYDNELPEFSYFNKQHERFIENTRNNKNKIELIRELSYDAYPDLIKKYSNKIDFIYIDGDHRASAVYNDAKNCFELCKQGGHILFDDYLWCRGRFGENDTYLGIDKFLEEYSGKYEIIVKDSQVLIKKH
jgi:predicted O-methyltransferase YrrM